MEITLHVEGMMCQHCQAHVKEALGKVAGVSNVDVSLSEKKATVKAEEGIDPDTLLKAVKEAGYNASIIK